MYVNAMALFDKSGSPYMPQINFDLYANIKYNDLVEEYGKNIEQLERLKTDFQYLYTVYSKANSNIIDRVVDVPTFRRRLRCNTTYKDCNGVIQTVNVRPLTNSEIDVAQNDPFNKGIDADPCDVETQLPNGNPGWQLFSDTVPLTYNFTFIRIPQNIDSANNPNTIFEGPDYIANYIVRAAVYDMDVTIENYERAKAEQSDLAQVLSNP